MTSESALHAVCELRAATFDLLEAAADRDAGLGDTVSEAVDRLQAVANELGALEDLLRRLPPAERPLRLRAARAQQHGRQR